MSPDNAEVIRRSIAAFNRGDIDAALAPYADDVEWRDLQPAPDAPDAVQGIVALRGVLAEWLTAFPGMRAEIVQQFDAGDAVVCVVDWRGIGKESGAAISQRTVDVFELRDEKVVRVTLGYRSKADALDAVSGSD